MVRERSATTIAACALGLLVFVALMAGAAAAGFASLFGFGSGPAPSQAALAAIPQNYLMLYERAAATCPGLSWTVLAAIGTVESGNGTSTAPGVHGGANSAGAEGPMQFLPSTFAAYDRPIPPGGADPPNPYDPADAIYAAARDLCANGARGGRDIPAAIFAYNHSDAYVAKVLGLATHYGAISIAPGPAAAAAINYALTQLGTPYVYADETPGVGFDCSGLAQASYRAAGIDLPRTAQTQFDAGPQVPAGSPLAPGDLVFFGSSTSNVAHVGVYIGQGDMIDAPHTGAVVRIEPYGWSDYLGATRPAE
jgi:cell wall-associated NlpC family hydrolase